jgi:hypothetical protein
MVIVGMPVPLKNTACAFGVCPRGGQADRPVVDVGDVVEAAVADYLETVCLMMRLAPKRDLGAIGRAERDSLCAKGLKGGGNTAKGGSKGYRVLSMQALQELGLGTAAQVCSWWPYGPG